LQLGGDYSTEGEGGFESSCYDPTQMICTEGQLSYPVSYGWHVKDMQTGKPLNHKTQGWIDLGEKTYCWPNWGSEGETCYTYANQAWISPDYSYIPAEIQSGHNYVVQYGTDPEDQIAVTYQARAKPVALRDQRWKDVTTTVANNTVFTCQYISGADTATYPCDWSTPYHYIFNSTSMDLIYDANNNNVIDDGELAIAPQMYDASNFYLYMGLIDGDGNYFYLNSNSYESYGDLVLQGTSTAFVPRKYIKFQLPGNRNFKNSDAYPGAEIATEESDQHPLSYFKDSWSDGIVLTDWGFMGIKWEQKSGVLSYGWPIWAPAIEFKPGTIIEADGNYNGNSGNGNQFQLVRPSLLYKYPISKTCTEGIAAGIDLAEQLQFIDNSTLDGVTVKTYVSEVHADTSDYEIRVINGQPVSAE
jgi:hypothetical protein